MNAIQIAALVPEAGRAAARLAWARAVTGDPALELERASVDAGFRSYWRAASAGGSRIVMDSPPALEDVRPWLRIRGLLLDAGVRVPQVLAQDLDAGFLLLEDLGRDTCLQVVDDDNADALFDAAFEQLLILQAIACPPDLPRYDRAMLQQELDLLEPWLLVRHLGAALDDGDRAGLRRVHETLVGNLLAQPQVFVHRDFMPRNLMPVAGGLAVIDFQGAVRGPIGYDPVSLFRDAFHSWPPQRVDAWLQRYHARAGAAGLPVPGYDDFRRDADFAGVQRHLKILGLFARLHHRDGKPKYLADAPRFVAYLDEVLPRYPELSPLRSILDRHVRPALQGTR
ncbi:aminoglycoside phosphotransferase family protein [Luteimonas sp. R10]|uniref:aminoglycoside phosphotransferase family protein n=1 Tax=Luteimonas sp. R10 TaxID=3108176 RepID=UPI0030858AA3|nr:phosphotransferase [Luteimonas sp. R10]